MRSSRGHQAEELAIVHTIPGLVAILTPANGTVHVDDLPRVAGVFTRPIAAGDPYDFEARIRRFDRVYRFPFQDSVDTKVLWTVPTEW